MAWRFLLIALLLGASGPFLRAIEYMPTSSYEETVPTSTNIADWSTGWLQLPTQTTGTLTGWNYVGQIGTESGTYLGNGWVITCAHVGAGNFVLNKVTYPMVANSTHSFYDGSTPFDFLLFRVSPAPRLPTLILRQTDPVAGTTPFAMIGFGTPTNVESWGYDTVTDVNQSTKLNGFVTNDFRAYGSNDANYQNVNNDSGGGDFIYNAAAKQWELGGLNEANNSNTDPTVSFFVQLNTYAAQIQAVFNPPAHADDTPVMPGWALVLMGSFLFCVGMPSVLFERR